MDPIQSFYPKTQKIYMLRPIQLLEGLIPEAHAAQAANPECAGMHERLQAFFAAKNQGGGGDMAADQAQESQRWT